MSAVAHNIETIRRELPASVTLMAVTKQVSIELIREAYAAGIRDFGESKIQEAQFKQDALADLPDLRWHLIGHLQGNKVRKALQMFDWIHSIDSLKLVHQVDRLAAELQIVPKICLQVKILPDPDKFGWSIPELIADLPEISKCEHIQIGGLMAIPPLGLTLAQTQQYFENTRDLSIQISQHPDWQLPMTELSIGMSGDYRLAVAAGSTIVRLGSIIFGERQRTNP
jgi:PLP dependent protein